MQHQYDSNGDGDSYVEDDDDGDEGYSEQSRTFFIISSIYNCKNTQSMYQRCNGDPIGHKGRFTDLRDYVRILTTTQVHLAVIVIASRGSPGD